MPIPPLAYHLPLVIEVTPILLLCQTRSQDLTRIGVRRWRQLRNAKTHRLGCRRAGVLFVVEVACVDLASKSVKYSATTGLVSCCTLRSAGSRRPALHDFPFGTLWQGTGTTLAFETPIDAPLTDPGMDDPERR